MFARLSHEFSQLTIKKKSWRKQINHKVNMDPCAKFQNSEKKMMPKRRKGEKAQIDYTNNIQI